MVVGGGVNWLTADTFRMKETSRTVQTEMGVDSLGTTMPITTNRRRGSIERDEATSAGISNAQGEYLKSR